MSDFVNIPRSYGWGLGALAVLLIAAVGLISVASVQELLRISPFVVLAAFWTAPAAVVIGVWWFSRMANRKAARPRPMSR